MDYETIKQKIKEIYTIQETNEAKAEEMLLELYTKVREPTIIFDAMIELEPSPEHRRYKDEDGIIGYH